MDVIALDRAGIAEVVAPNGTAVTEAQLERMWRLDPSPILCFDGDSAGRKAAIRAALRALPHIGPERTLRFVELPAGQDPDDVVRNSGGREAFEALLAEPRAARRPAVAARARRRAADHARGPRRPAPAADRPCRDHRRPGAAPALPRPVAQPLRRPRSPAAPARSRPAPQRRGTVQERPLRRRPSRPSATARAASPRPASTPRPPAR